MADDRHVQHALAGSAAWNRWRAGHGDIVPDLSNARIKGAALAGADLSFANLFAAELSEAALDSADFNSANLMYADLTAADLAGSDFRQANMFAADLSRSDLHGARFSGAHASGARFRSADLAGANLFVADISRADLSSAVLTGANCFGSILTSSNFTGADCRDCDLSGADLSGALLADIDFTGANLSDCRIKGVTTGDLALDESIQKDLVLTDEDEPEIAVDGLEAGLYISRLIRGSAGNGTGRKPQGETLLLLGRYPHERRAFLNGIREEIRKAGYVPLLFDFENSGKRDFTPVVAALAGESSFTLLDLGGMRELPGEVVDTISAATGPIQPFVAGPMTPGATTDLGGVIDKEPLLELFQTDDTAGMIAALTIKVIPPAREA